jgi:hypothetical protein
LNHASDAVHAARAAGLSAGLQLGGDLLQNLRPQALIDRPGQGEQYVHLFIVELQRRHGRLRAWGWALMTP